MTEPPNTPYGAYLRAIHTVLVALTLAVFFNAIGEADPFDALLFFVIPAIVIYSILQISRARKAE